MTDSIVKMLSYTFMLRALAVGILVSLCCALLGVSLVLKRYSMIGDGLSHVGFGALAVATALGISPMQFTIPIVIIAAVLILRMNTSGKIKGDSAIGILSVSALAIGVISVSLSKGLNTDLYSYLFGSVLAASSSDVVLSIVLAIIVILLYAVYYNRIFAVTFDENFAKASGTNVAFYNTLIAVLTAVTIVLGMRMMGTLIISALIIFPAVTSMRLCKSFRAVTLCAAALSVVCFCTGIYASYAYDLPTGAAIVVANLAALIVFSAVKSVTGK